MTGFGKIGRYLALAGVLLISAAPAKKSGSDVAAPATNTASTDPQSEPVDAGPREIVQPTELLDQSAATASASQGATYAIDWYSINGGGTVNASSTNYKMGASVGQSVAGAASSASYQLGIGFWYGAGGSGGCACDCHADPAPIGACDGVPTVLDVSQCINVAFRGAAAIPDPNGNCPYETTDTNCDNVTTIIDVTKMINVAFRAGNPAIEFCNPCA